MSTSEIERFAEETARRHHFDSTRKPVRDLALQLGGRLEIISLNEYRELDGGSLIVDGPGDFLIRLSPITGLLRDNFTIAHELGHYFLHSGEPPGTIRIRVGRWGSDLVEQQANRFAAALLMPRGVFVDAMKRFHGDAQLAAALFNVSPKAAEIRVRSLRLAC